ncbi:alkaline phosphatase D family protein [Saccharopolyspora gregorii]|uniref:PhoD-like phosphatase metallophosphatase domain-containing protein n=1 Tax=Saccharopolyspora gregorii TaxID=33914 RepID=A0ABP6RKI2_9PSEU
MRTSARATSRLPADGEDQPGLILHLGDYQYEYAAEDDDVRRVLGPETRTLANYRQRHAQYKTDADLQLAHATAPWIVVWDDHETENNWAGDVPETPDEHFLDRRAAAFQAYYENMPLRSSAKPVGADMRLYRRLGWGGTTQLRARAAAGLRPGARSRRSSARAAVPVAR